MNPNKQQNSTPRTVSTKRTKRQEMKEATERFRLMHHQALETLRAPDCDLSGLQLWRKCVKLERLAHAAATACCNGETIRVVWPLYGLREYDWSKETTVDELRSVVRGCVRDIFGHVPAGFWLNLDARGYALKIDPDSAVIPAGMHTDWGRNGILAAEINTPE